MGASHDWARVETRNVYFIACGRLKKGKSHCFWEKLDVGKNSHV